MNKNGFYGLRDVFSFTFKQKFFNNRYKYVTLGMAAFVFALGMLYCVISSISQKRAETEITSIERVYVVDESGFFHIALEENLKNKEKYANLSFDVSDSTIAELKDKLEDPYEVILHIEEFEKGHKITLHIPEFSKIRRAEIEAFLEDVKMAVKKTKLFSTDIAMEDMVYLLSGIYGTMSDAGETGKSLGEELFGMILPYGVAFFLLFMTLLYGQSVGNVISEEKTSRLMEMILTMTNPNSLMFGKILATACISMVQTSCLVAGLVAGFGFGDVIAGELIYPEYQNKLLQIIQLIRLDEGSNALTIGGLVVAFLSVCLSFLFFCVLAGLIANFASKQENLAEVMSYYNLSILIGCFGMYMYMKNRNGWLSIPARIFPIISAYILPGDIMMGYITIGEGIFYEVILLAFTIGLSIIAGKIYKNQLFYKGTGIKNRK